MTPDTADAWEAFSTALETYEPPCTGWQDLFTAEALPDEQRLFCESICEQCDVIALCNGYATLAAQETHGLDVGVWGGHQYTRNGKRPAGTRQRTPRKQPAAPPA